MPFSDDMITEFNIHNGKHKHKCIICELSLEGGTFPINLECKCIVHFLCIHTQLNNGDDKCPNCKTYVNKLRLKRISLISLILKDCTQIQKEQFINIIKIHSKNVGNNIKCKHVIIRTIEFIFSKNYLIKLISLLNKFEIQFH